jgi:hypothetical protein
MLKLARPRLRSYAALLAACVLFHGPCGAATGVTAAIASATVLASPLSASVRLFVRTAPAHLCTAVCLAAPAGTSTAVAGAIPVNLDQDGIAQFTMFGDTTSNYVVRLNDSAYGAWPDRIGTPIVLEPTLSREGRLSIVVGRAPSRVFAGAFQVVINYN